MASELKDFIKTYDGLMEPRFCQRLIDNFEKKEENQERIDREKRPTFTELNISKQYQKKDPDWIPAQVQIQEKFIECVERYMEELDVGAEVPEMELGAEEEPVPEEEPAGEEEIDDLAGLMGESNELDEDTLVNEIMKIIEDSDDLLEEELIVDMGHEKDGTFRTDEGTLEYYKEMQNRRYDYTSIHLITTSLYMALKLMLLL